MAARHEKGERQRASGDGECSPHHESKKSRGMPFLKNRRRRDDALILPAA
jgi:hypothetical protein